MALLGIILVLVAFAAGIFALVQHRRAKKILAAPFHKTGEVATNPSLADAKGVISFEGAAVTDQPIMAPCSGTPCVYYEIEVERLWEKTEYTEDGSKKTKGKTNVKTDKVGSVFGVNDGTGQVSVDARAGVKIAEKEMKVSLERHMDAWWGDLSLNQYSFHVPHDNDTYGVKVTERIVEPQGTLFVVGKHTGQSIVKTDGMLGSLQLSTKGRDALVGSQQKKAKYAMIGAAAAMVLGVPSTIFGEMPQSSGLSGPSCSSILRDGLDTAAGTCGDKVTSSFGVTYTWNVKQAGTYAINVSAPSGVKYPIIPVLSVKSPTGKELSDGYELDETMLSPGTYTVTVWDADLKAGRAKKFKGGFSYNMKVKAVPTSTTAITNASAKAPSEKLGLAANLNAVGVAPVDAGACKSVATLGSVCSDTHGVRQGKPRSFVLNIEKSGTYKISLDGAYVAGSGGQKYSNQPTHEWIWLDVLDAKGKKMMGDDTGVNFDFLGKLEKGKYTLRATALKPVQLAYQLKVVDVPTTL